MKKNYILIFVIIVCIYGCSRAKIKQINFYVHNDTCFQKLDTITIIDIEKINKIQTLFNCKKQEPLKFMITYNVDFIYQNGKKERYSGQGQWIRTDNKTYILTSDSLINSILESKTSK
ncbi:hypothetical protein SAMN05444405_10543 [Bacteroides luti]|uniref:Uncharacterized protein n=2 Tax=Bacteroides luti TaxID=1297750 RepID=A0A1M4YPA8_9BACE|nr:hypothetical protein SAMN05444405_10543 [Bacteroides luti]